MPDQGLFCIVCGKQTLHRSSEKVNHVLHFLITFFTCGLWGIIWLILSVGAHNSAHVCTVCGQQYDQYAVDAWRQQQLQP
jgi:hypothetical protein